jgi:hypothetical protein
VQSCATEDNPRTLALQNEVTANPHCVNNSFQASLSFESMKISPSSVIRRFDFRVAHAELGAESDWLCQDILVMDPSTSSSSHKYPSNWDQERIWKLRRVKEWDLGQEMEDYAKWMDRKKQAFETLVTKVTELKACIRKQEIAIANFLVELLFFFMETKYTHKLIQLDFDVSIVPTSDASGASGSSDAMASLHVGNPRADIVITADGRNAVVFETKSGGLGPLQGDPWPLHKVWAQQVLSGLLCYIK